jgi:type I restriction enzyme S subunit
MSDWPKQRFGDILSLEYGKALPEANRDGSGTCVVAGSNGPQGVHSQSLAKAPAIVIGRKGSAGQVNWFEQDVWAIDTTYFVVPKAAVNYRWLYYCLRSVGLSELATATGVPGLNRNDVYQLDVVVPPLPEQERFVRILDEAEALRRLRGDADERTSHIRAALFDKMFGNASSNSKGWETATLGRLGTVMTGNTPPRSDSSFYGDFIEWVKTDNIDPTRGVVTRATEGLSEGGALRGRLVPAGAVLVTCIAGSIERIGDAAVVDREVAINQQINALIPSNNVASAFLAELVLALREAIQNRAAGVMTRIINKSTLEAVPAIWS